MAALLRRLRVGPLAAAAAGSPKPRPALLAEPQRRAMKLDPEEELDKLSVARRRFDAAPPPASASRDIGLPYERESAVADRRQRLATWSERRRLEPLARQRKLAVDIGQVERDHAAERGPEHARIIAEHYALYEHLFRDSVHFYPVVGLRVRYDYDGDAVTPVFSGNRLQPADAAVRPSVEIEEGRRDAFSYCLLLTSLDGHLTDADGEYLHWFVGNIRGGDVSAGQELCSYLQPIPPRGTGYHRYVFLLFQQLENVIDFSEAVKVPTGKLSERSFSTAGFFQRYSGRLVPAGLNFFQCKWDESVRKTFYDVLDMKEPAYEYDFPEPYHPKQVVYPHKQAFNLYLDRYRDRKDIREQALKEKLRRWTLQNGESQDWKYPLAVPYRRAEQPPTWLELQQYNRRARRNLWKYAYEDD